MKTINRGIYNSLIIAIIILAGLALNVAGATFTVTNTNDTGAGSLRQAVLDANAATTADTIVFDASFGVPRSITLVSTISISPAVTADNLTITGPGASLLTITKPTAAGSRIFFIGSNNAQPDTTTITGINFSAAVGGAIDNRAILTVSNCTFTNIVSTTSGTAIYNHPDGTLTVTDSVFTGNGSPTGAGSGTIDNDGIGRVSNSTFTSNTMGLGGGIANGGTLTVTGSTFTNNTATSGSATGLGGGAIYSSSSVAGVAATISNSIFTGNAETGNSGGGGAIRNRSGTMNISNSTFTDNTSVSAGGAFNGGGVANISGSTFTGNSTAGSGGALSNTGGAQSTISNSVITGNSAVGHGGGIYYQPNAGGASMIVTNTTISNNVANTNTDATGSGGGFYIAGTGGVTVRGSTISGNLTKINTQTTDLRFSGDGGGFFVQGALTLENSTVSGNVAEQDFGGIGDTNPGGSGDQVHISNSTIVGNRAAGNVGGFGIDSVSDAGDQSLSNTIIANNTSSGTAQDVRTAAPINSLGYNLIENVTGANIGGTTTGNITGVDPNLGPLQDNGGRTHTHAPLANSPVIDKGNTFGVTIDQRGLPRTYDYPGISNAAGGDAADIGAVELRPTAQVSGRVATPGGLGLRSANVILTDSLGNRTTATTSSFGIYLFPTVPVGLNYTIGVSSKRYRFASRQVTVNSDLGNVDFVGLE